MMELGSSEPGPVAMTLCSATSLGGQGPHLIEFIFNCAVSSELRMCSGENSSPVCWHLQASVWLR